MTRGRNRVLAGIVGGMAGGAAMAMALYAVRHVDLSRVPILRNISDETDQMSFIGTMSGSDSGGTVAKSIMFSALLGGVYGGMRSTLHIPGFLFGPAFGVASFALSRIGLGQEVSRTPGPWNNREDALIPRLVAGTVYGMVTDRVTERVENSLS